MDDSVSIFSDFLSFEAQQLLQELGRYMFSRHQDVTLLSNNTKELEFREEWRIAREDEVLEKLFHSPYMHHKQMGLTHLIHDSIGACIQQVYYTTTYATTPNPFPSFSPFVHRLCYKHPILRNLFFEAPKFSQIKVNPNLILNKPTKPLNERSVFRTRPGRNNVSKQKVSLEKDCKVSSLDLQNFSNNLNAVGKFSRQKYYFCFQLIVILELRN